MTARRHPREAPPSSAADETMSLVPIGGAASDADLRPPSPASPWDRYEDVGLLGRGGMGEVRRVRDRVLGRVVAMKILAARAAPGLAARFLAEARLAAGLGHPGIVPVHDCGATSEGDLWFTMDEIRGHTLSAAVDAAHGEPGGPSSAALRRLADMFLRVCEAVAHAHHRGVIHRDLKPDNIMIGDLGEVLVADWGLARALAEADRETDAGLVSGPRSTQIGQVLGTPCYMPPEQAAGLSARADRTADVYALGAVLYEILSGAPPYVGSARAVVAQVIAGPPEPLARRAAASAPEDLVLICEAAMARAPRDRFADAGALAAEVRRYLDGERRRERALARVAEAQAMAPETARRKAQARALRAEASALLASLDTFAPVADKARGWALEDAARAVEVDAAVQETAFQTQLHAALAEAPDLAEAHAVLADLHATALLAAEDARDPAAAARAAALLAQHDRGRHAALLDGRSSLSLATTPPGAEVWASRYVERGRRLFEAPAELLGRTPLRDVPLAAGSYLLRVRAPGFVEMRLPVHLRRGAAHQAIRPGDSVAFAVPLLPEGAPAPDEVYVPAGSFRAGGDAAAGESLPAQDIWVDGFVIDRDPVTVATYLAFLNDLVAQGRAPDAEQAAPALPRSVAGAARVPLFPRDEHGRFTLPPGAHAELPVVSMTWLGAAAYAAWRAAATKQPWRLASEIEREKAARGVDGRFFPWGDQPEPTWASMAGSAPGAPALAKIDAYPVDESPYGVRGLAGNVRDWCAEAWTQPGPLVESGILRVVPAPLDAPGLRSIRGGAYYSGSQLCRAAGRFAARPGDCGAGIGLRLVRTV